MIRTGENRSARRKTCPTPTLCTTKPKSIVLGLNSGLCGDRKATNRLNHSTVPTFFFQVLSNAPSSQDEPSNTRMGKFAFSSVLKGSANSTLHLAPLGSWILSIISYPKKNVTYRKMALFLSSSERVSVGINWVGAFSPTLKRPGQWQLPKRRVLFEYVMMCNGQEI